MWAISHSVSTEEELEASAFFINRQKQIQSKLWKISDCFFTREINSPGKGNQSYGASKKQIFLYSQHPE